MNKPAFKLRLDAFPFETDALFGLLILAVIMQAVMLGNALMLLFGVGSLDSSDPAAQGNDLITAFMPTVIVSLAILLIVFGSAFISYRRHPSDIRSRKKIYPIGEKDDKLKGEVHKLARQVNITHPRIEMELSGLKGASGQAFGLGSPFSIRLDGGLRVWLKTRPDLFKAVVLHEFAHIANKDIFRSYYSQSIWWSIGIFIAIPFLIVIGIFPIRAVFWGILEGNLLERLTIALPVAAQLFVEVGSILAVTWMIWARLLRSREYYADGQAAAWGAMNGLRRIFQAQIETSEKGNSKFSLFHLHPSVQERFNVLEHPETLYKVSKVFSALVGVLLAYLLSGFFYAGFSLFAVVQEYIQMYLPRFVWFVVFISFLLLMILFIAWVISDTLGVQIQKQAMLDLASEYRGFKRYFKMFWVALSFSIGIELGFVAAPFGLLAPQGVSDWLFEIFLGFPVLVLIAWLYVAYVGFVSVRVFGSRIGKELPKKSRLLVTVLIMTWLIILFVPQLLVTKFSIGSNFAILVPMYFIMLGATLMISVGFIGITWVIVNLSVPRQLTTCPVCGENRNGTISVITICKKCNSPLGSWLLLEQPTTYS